MSSLYTTLLLTHISTAVIGILSGFLSMAFRKGSGLHRAAGDVFVVSMVMMSGAGAFIAAFLKPNMGNVLGGSLTFYLVATGWLAGRRRERRVGAFDFAALLIISAIFLTEFVFAAQALTSPTHLKAGYPAFLFFILGTISLLFAASDVRVIVRGGIEGSQRIARHVFRMCLSLLMATLSFYPSRAHLFSKAINDSRVLYVPHIVLIVSMIYWLIRIRRRRQHGRAITSESRTFDWSGHAALNPGSVQR
jgi:uncharacterized membrane protein